MVTTETVARYTLSVRRSEKRSPKSGGETKVRALEKSELSDTNSYSKH